MLIYPKSTNAWLEQLTNKGSTTCLVVWSQIMSAGVHSGSYNHKVNK